MGGDREPTGEVRCGPLAAMDGEREGSGGRKRHSKTSTHASYDRAKARGGEGLASGGDAASEAIHVAE